MRKITLAIPVLCGLLWAVGCAQPPSAQLNAAEQAVKDAQTSGAGTYLAEDYAKLEGMLVALKKEVSEQEGKFSLLRDYGKAEQLAVGIQAEAERIKTEAAKKMEEAKLVAMQTYQDAQNTVKSMLELISRAPAGKDRAALESLKSDADVLKASLTEVQIMIDRSDFLSAQTKAKAIQDKAQAVSVEIETALTKIGKGKSASVKRK